MVLKKSERPQGCDAGEESCGPLPARKELGSWKETLHSSDNLSHDLVGETGAQTGLHLAGELLALHTCGLLLTGGPWRLKGPVDVLVIHPGVPTE